MQRMNMEPDQHPSWSEMVRLKCYKEGKYHFRGRLDVFSSTSSWQNDVQGENEVIRRWHPQWPIRSQLNLRDLFIELILLSECRGPSSLFTLLSEASALTFLLIRRRLWYNFNPYYSMWVCYLSCLIGRMGCSRNKYQARRHMRAPWSSIRTSGAFRTRTHPSRYCHTESRKMMWQISIMRWFSLHKRFQKGGITPPSIQSGSRRRRAGCGTWQFMKDLFRISSRLKKNQSVRHSTRRIISQSIVRIISIMAGRCCEIHSFASRHGWHWNQ